MPIGRQAEVSSYLQKGTFLRDSCIYGLPIIIILRWHSEGVRSKRKIVKMEKTSLSLCKQIQVNFRQTKVAVF